MGLGYSTMVWLINDVAVDDLAIKTPWLVNMASALCRQCRHCCCVVVEVVVDTAEVAMSLWHEVRNKCGIGKVT